MPVTLTVFDGANIIGGNKIYLEFDGNGAFFDFGTNYKKIADFYEEFLSPRPSRGLHDLLYMGIIPKISCYRRDLVPSDVDLSSSLKVKVDAVFLSHGHLDHAGNIGLLNANIPIVASPMSTAILKAMMDCGSAAMESEVAYAASRKASEEDARILKTEDYRKSPYIGREFLIAGECNGDLKNYWCACPHSRKLQYKEIKPAKDNLDFEFKAFELDHSIYGATGYAINPNVLIYTA